MPEIDAATGDFDLAVIGAGPGGAACALAAARARLRVLLVDPQGEVFDKPCGEGLMPSGLAVLRELGLGDVSNRAFAFRHLRFVLPGRPALDLELESEASACLRTTLLDEIGGALRGQADVHRVRAHARASASTGGFEIHLKSAGPISAERVARARVLVAADGGAGRAASWLRGPQRRRRSRRIGIRARYHLAQGLDRVEIHLGLGADVYLTPLPDGLVNVAVLLEDEPTGARGAEAWCDWALERHPGARARLGRSVTPAGARLLDRTPPVSVARGDAFLVGDAAGALDPILGCGVSLALESGLAAARAASARKDGARAEDVARTYRVAWHRLASKRSRLALGLRFLGSHPRLAAGCVEILRRSPRSRRWLCRMAAGDHDG